MKRVDAAPLDAVLQLIADWSPLALEASGTTPDLDTWRDVIGIEGEPLAPGPGELQSLAARLHAVFLGDTAAARRDALNELIGGVAPRPRLGAVGHEWEVPPGSDVQVAALVLALWLHAAADPDLDRLGTCGAERCLDPYVDATQAVNRRYCSATCQNRAKVAAYRHRRRSSSRR